MDLSTILNNRFAEPAAIIEYSCGSLKTVGITRNFLSELWMNIAEETYLNDDISSCFDENNLNIYLTALSRCAKTGEDQTCETWRSFASNCCGADKICLASRFVLLEKNEERALVYEAVRNLTNERRTQSTLADIDHRYKSASEQINIYNWEYTVATKEMRPCYRCMRDLGLPAVVKNYPEPAIDAGIFPPDYADMYREMMRQIDAGAKELEADIPLTVGRVPFRIKYTTEFDAAGKPVKAFGSATLISETELGAIKLDNQVIASLAEEYDSIFLADFVMGKVRTFKNAGKLSLPEDATYQDIAELLVPFLKDQPGVSESLIKNVNFVRAMLFKDSDRREFVCKDEENNRWNRIGFHVIERSSGTVDRLLITSSALDDLRAQKLDDDRLIAAQKAELEDRQKLLIEAIDEANKANLAKTVFFSNMSHDIRTPMNAITGFARLALEDVDNREQLTDHLNKIVSAGDHLMNLINDILDMSRIESGKMELAPVPVRIKDLFLECADMVRDNMADRKVNFTTDAKDLGDDTVLCDKLRFRQVLLNLLSNACKFTPAGGSVDFSGRLLNRGKKLTYEFNVKDTGIGMSDDFKTHIWEAYSREKTGAVNETQGTGLGMAIVHNIISLMKGTIDLKTAPGQGSEFIFTLSFEPSDKDAAVSEHDIAVKEATSKRYDGRTVLLVDDIAINLKLCEHLLAKYGFKVIECTNGVDAIRLVKDSRPGDIDLVLMDVQMPVMDGLEATRRIRALKDERLANIPIIAMTANAFESDIRDTHDAGMNAHISKPFLPGDMLATINEILESI